MPKKKNFLGGMQNYNAQNGEYEPALKGPNGESPSSFKSFKKSDGEKKEDFNSVNNKRIGKPNTENDKMKEWKEQYNKAGFFQLDKEKYPDVEQTSYGFIYNVNGKNITDIAAQNKMFGMPGGSGFSVEIGGDESFYETFDEAYNAAKGGKVKEESKTESKEEKIGKIIKYSPYKNMGGGVFKKDDDNQVRVKTLHNGLAMETKATPNEHIYHEQVGKYKLVDLDTGTMVGWAKDYEDAVKKSQDQDFIGAINRAKETFYNRHPDMKPEIQAKQKEFNAEIKKTADEIRGSGERYTYMMLDRLRSDVEYTFGNGKGATGHLWYDGNPDKHIALMKELYTGLKDKPEWLTMDKINEYETKFKEMKKED